LPFASRLRGAIFLSRVPAAVDPSTASAFRDSEGSRGLSVVRLALCRLVQLVGLLCKSERSKEFEILVLRRELAILRGQPRRARLPQAGAGASSAEKKSGKAATRAAFAEPSDGLEPSTPSLPCAPIGNGGQPLAKVGR
jgi:hypothetical protein